MLDPQLPTDSMYKFLALFGLLLIAIPFIWAEKIISIRETANNIEIELQRRQMERIHLEEEQEGLMREIYILEGLSQGFASIQREMNLSSEELMKVLNLENREVSPSLSLEKLQQLDTSSEANFLLLNAVQQNDRLEKLRNRLEQVKAQLKRVTDENYGNHMDREKMKDTRFYGKILICTSVLFVAAGLILTATGFITWYFKLQRHIDRDLCKRVMGRRRSKVRYHKRC